MKRRYQRLVSIIQLVALFAFAIGLLSVIIGFTLATTNGGNAVIFGISTIITSLLLGACAAGVDLLASIEVNTRTTAAYFEKRSPGSSSKS